MQSIAVKSLTLPRSVKANADFGYILLSPFGPSEKIRKSFPGANWILKNGCGPLRGSIDAAAPLWFLCRLMAQRGHALLCLGG
jgi:hypothetical protein